MKSLPKEKMLKYILTTIEDKEITVYAIAKATNIKQTTIHNIVNKKTLNPHENNVKLIYDYLFNRFGTEEEKPLYKIGDNLKEEEINLPQSDFEKLLETKIEEVVKRLTDDKFQEINENLLFVIRRAFDVSIENGNSAKDVIKKID